MSEYICDFGDKSSAFVGLAMAEATAHGAELREEIVRCRDCKHMSVYRVYEIESNQFSDVDFEYSCEGKFANDEWPIYVEPDGFCAWGEKK